MSFFTSNREKRLWVWTLAVVIAIYSTLGLASKLAKTFEDSQWIGVGLFMFCCLLVLATIAVQGLKRTPSGMEIAVVLGIVAAYTLVFIRMSIPTERSHLIEYGVVAIFIYEALLERAKQGRNVPVPAILAIIATALIGVVDECIQGVIPSRVFDLRDILFNFLAGLMAVAASTALRWARGAPPNDVIEK